MATDIPILYERSPSYRRLHVDGAHGNISGRGTFVIDFYSESNYFPKQGSLKIEGVGLPAQTENKSKLEVQRLVECGIIMEYSTAVSLKNWLETLIKNYEETIPEEIMQLVNKK